MAEAAAQAVAPVAVFFLELYECLRVAGRLHGQAALLPQAGDVIILRLQLVQQVDGAVAQLLLLAVAAYGSYYRLGEYDDPAETFRRSLVSAVALGAPTIRVWAGTKASADADEAYRAKLAQEARLIAEMAAKENITVAFEWHKNTLTDTNESGMVLLAAADHPNLKSLWQPTVALTPAQRVEGIRLLGDRLVNMHVYSWPDGKRGPLNAAEWKLYFDAATCGGSHYALMEFVRDNTPEQFAEDAARLIDLIENGGYHG